MDDTPRDDDVQRILPAQAGQTLAAVLRRWRPEWSWSQVRRVIAARRVLVNEALCLDEARRLDAGETVRLLAQAAPAAPYAADVRLRYCDDHLVVVEKPAGMKTLRHAPERDWSARRRQLQPTLDDVLPELIAQAERSASRPHPADRLPRLRSVHRLDRDTSGLLVFARSPDADRGLVAQFARHTVQRSYLALVHGHPAAGTIRSHIARDRGDGRRGSVADPQAGQRAVTHILPREQIGRFTLIVCRLETGRTHQIRIHLSEAGHPVCGDPKYGDPAELAPRPFSRLMLHAAELGFTHPVTGRPLHFDMPPPRDFQAVLERLRRRN